MYSILSQAESCIEAIKTSLGKTFFGEIESNSSDDDASLTALKKQLKPTNMSASEVPDEAYEAIALTINEALGDSVFENYETEPAKMLQQIVADIKGGLKSIDKDITVNNKKYHIHTYVNALYGLGFGYAAVSWNENSGKKVTAQIKWTNVGTDKGFEALAKYCIGLAELNKEVWNDFMGYALDVTGTGRVKNYISLAESFVKAICDHKYANELIEKIGGTVASKLKSSIFNNKFKNFIKNNVPDGDILIEAADVLKDLESSYNELCSAIENNTGINVRANALAKLGNELENLLGLRETSFIIPDETTLPDYATARGSSIVLKNGFWNTFDLTKFSRDEKDIDASSVSDSITIYGDDRNNTIRSGKGSNNHIYGSKGNDILYGGTGRDYYHYYNKDGNDIIYNFTASDRIDLHNVNFNNASFRGTDVILNLSSGNTITLKDAKNKYIDLYHYNSSDWSDRSLGRFTALNSSYIILSADYEGNFDSKFYALNPQHINASAVTSGMTINGDARNNTIRVGNGNSNTVYADAGNDTITCGTGTYNYIYGGTGNDTITFGSGYDELIYYNGDGNETVYNFTSSDDIYLRSGVTFENASFNGSDVILNLSSGNTITLKGAKNQIIDINGTVYIDRSLGRFTALNSSYIILSADYEGNFDSKFYALNPQHINASAVTSSMTINGDAFSNIICVGTGSYNTVNAGYGDDIIYGSSGNDTIYGDGGHDVAIYDSSDWGYDTIKKTSGKMTILFSGLSSSDITMTKSGTSMNITKVSDSRQSISIQNWDESSHNILFGGSLAAFNKFVNSTSPTAQQISAATSEVWKKAMLA
ncbi:MAG: hypothetical protein IJD65_06850 [Mailhella sp.]|nr:hypothetical protein [Mailhella sp.]